MTITAALGVDPSEAFTPNNTEASYVVR
jgi:hypothetical protein